MLKNILILLFICNFYTKHSRAQGGFIKRHDIAGYDNPYYTTIIASDTCYWAFGIIWDTTSPYLGGTAVFKFDLQGNLLKQRELISKTQFLGFNNDMYAFQNKLYTSILTPYSTSSIIAYDILSDSFQIVATVGNLLPEGDFLSINNLHFDLLGNCYLANSVSSKTTTDSYTQIQLVKFNKNFQIEWSKMLGNAKIDEIPYSIENDSTGNVYVGGQRLKLNYIEGDGSYSKSIVYKLSSDGKILKETTADSLSGAIYDFTIDEQGNYICASEILLPYHPQRPFLYPAYQKLEQEGKIVFRQYFEEAPKEEKLYSNFSKIRKIGDNYYALGGIGVFDDDIQPLIVESRAIFIKFNKSGNLVWKRIYKTGYGIEATNLYDFDKTQDGGFIMAGLGAVGANDSIGWKSMILKVDSLGCIIPGCQLTNNVGEKIGEKCFKIFPNPASNYLALYNVTNHKLVIYIFDSNGSELLKFRILSNETSIVDISNYPVGSYFVNAKFDEKTISSEIFIKE